jgi:hypothetical protein
LWASRARLRRSQVITLSKRVNLAASSYQQAFDRFQALLTHRQPDLAQQTLLAQQQEGA